VSNDSIDIQDIHGDVIGAKISGEGNIVGKTIHIHGDVILQMVDPSPSMLKQTSKIANVSTEIDSKESSKDTQYSKRDIENMQRSIDEILNLVNAASQQGQYAQQVKVGELQFSHVEILLKKAILLKAEATQMYFDELERNKSKIEQVKSRAIGNTYQLDLKELLANFDGTAYTEKLEEALCLLQEANRLDPTNTKVLIHMAQLLGRISEDNAHEVRRILYRVLNLLNHPKDDTEQFQKAEATFLLAILNDETHNDLLKEARAIFERLGQTGWVRQCDLILQTGKGDNGVAFHPVGQWQIQVSDGSHMMANFFPNGTFQGVQSLGIVWNTQFSGQWSFIPSNQILQVQGFINNYQPFVLSVTIHGLHNNGFYGTGTNGFSYLFIRI
jgi:hypothetical protein